MGLIKKIINKKNNSYSQKSLNCMAEIIGIQSDTLALFLNEPSIDNNSENLEQLNLFNKKICTKVQDDEFARRIKVKLSFIKTYGSFEIFNNSIKGKVKNHNLEYFLEIHITNNSVEFNVMGENCLLIGTYTRNEDNTSHIEYITKKLNSKENDSSNYKKLDFDICNCLTLKQIFTFDDHGIEIFRYEEKNKEDYFTNRQSGEKILNKQKITDNYIEKNFIWRASKDKIIKRYVKEYNPLINSNILTNIDYYLIGINQDPSSKKLIENTDYCLIEDKLYQQYEKGICDIDELWNKSIKNFQKSKRK